MNITYHKEIAKPDGVIASIPHAILDMGIRLFIDVKGCTQHEYYINHNDWYFFIYLDNGDRIDVALN